MQRMISRRTHYETAFEAYLQARGVPYVAVDQAKKAVFAGASIKSFDFLVYPAGARRLLVDVKGRRLSGRLFQKGRLGQSWTTDDDIEGLTQWEAVFGPDYVGAFVFAYWLHDADPRQPPAGSFGWEGKIYAWLLAELSAYRACMKSRSARWQTVWVPARQFDYIAKPLEQCL